MEIAVKNKIYVKDPTKQIIDFCRQNLVIDNPEYHKKERMGVWLGNTPRQLQLYEKNGDTYVLPFGCLKSIYAIDKTCPWSNHISPMRRVDYRSRINPYPYQEEAINAAIRARNGIVVMPCGAGKTQTALEIIARLGGKALWLTHTQDLLNQSMNRAKAVYDISKTEYGTITGGKVNIGNAITFATVQTMVKLDLTELRDAFDIIVVDECHKAVGSPTKCMQFYKVVSSLSARYKFGLTATPRRSDGLENTMFALLGGIVHEVSQEAVAGTTCPIKVKQIETGYSPNLDVVLAGDGTLNYASLVDDMIHDEPRFNFVSSYIQACAADGATLVLANRVEYLERLSEGVDGAICLSSLGNTVKAKNIRKEALRRLNNGGIPCLFATYQLAKEGLDVPNLRYVVFATPEKDSTTVIQAAGRVGRKADGKEFGTVVDFIDDFGMYRGWAKKRVGFYKKIQKNIDL